MKNNNGIFLLDSNSFVTPYKHYYAFDLVPAYWEAITPFITSGRIVILDIVKNEIMQGKKEEDWDELTRWLVKTKSLNIIKREEIHTINKYAEIMNYVKTCGLYKESALREWAKFTVADPWLIASAAVNNYSLVTVEEGSGGLSAQNPNKVAKIPDVAKHFAVRTINVFGMMRELNIKIV